MSTEEQRVRIRSVEREIVLDVDPERAWEAISDPERLAEWLADEVELEPLEGAPARFLVDGEHRPARVDRVEEGRELSFVWEREPARPSLVELQLEPCISGVRIRVIETDLGLPSGLLAAAWAGPLARLRSLFSLVAA